jgi:hypothetical protein
VKHFSLSNPIKPGELEQAYKDGMIRKSDLKDGKTYLGDCRNASVATWHADKNCFTYQRTKFGSTFPEDIFHPEDDDGFDIFTPFEEIP